MKTRLHSHLVKTFSFYAIIILIPLTVLIYQGVSALKNHKLQIESSVRSRLRQVGEEFYGDLNVEWQYFLEREKFRKFYHYQPLIVPDEEYIQSEGQAIQRSPLYPTVVRLRNLKQTGGGSAMEPGGRLPQTLDQIFENSLVGYFQFDPYRFIMSTPYDVTGTFQTSKRVTSEIEDYRYFLDHDFKTLLAKQLDLSPESDIDFISVLQHLKTRRITKSNEPAQKILRLRELRGAKNGEPVADQDGLVSTSYYDFTFFSFEHENVRYVAGIRPVLLGGNRLLIQGFIFNILHLIQEAQIYLDPFQPEHGSVVVGEFTPVHAQTMFAPFSILSIIFRLGAPEKYLQRYGQELRQFWFIIVCLMIALGVSMLHLGKLLSANMRLHRKKNDFISSITHELKAPLTSVIMYTEMLEEGWAKGKETTYYRYIHCESERLSRLIKNILDYSGLERGTFRLKQSTLLLHSFIDDSLDPLKVWLESSGLKVRLKVISTPSVNVDKDSLAQVIYNLCDNAIKYVKEVEDPTLTIIVDQTKTEAVLIVYDNGHGISKGDERRVFNRFYRCENELTRESTGTGLGLALVKDLVESNGGRISIYHPEDSNGFGVKILLPKIAAEPTLVPAH